MELVQPGGNGSGSGVTSISVFGDPQLTGDVTLSEGANITLTQVGQDIEIASTGGGMAIGDTVTGGTDNSILFISPAGVLAQKNPGFTFDESVNAMQIGDGGTLGSALGGFAASSALISGAGVVLLGTLSATTGGDAGLFYGIRSRGTIATPLSTINGDNFFGMGGFGFTSNNTLSGKPSATIFFTQDGASTTGGAPGRIDFVTNPGDGSNKIAISIRANHTTEFNNLAASAVLMSFTPGTTTGVLSLTGSLVFPGTTSGAVTIQPAAAAGTWTLTLPVNDGNADDVLRTNGSGVTSWVPQSGGGGTQSMGRLFAFMGS